MADENLENVLRELVEQQKKVAEALEKNARKGKDFWDKFGSMSTFLSTVVIAAIGAIFTHVYNLKQNERNEALKQQEIRIAQIQTVEKFVPYLTGSEDQKKIAILALNSLGNTEVATKLAALYPSEGTVAALKVIAGSGKEPERKLANQALQGIFDLQRNAVVQIAKQPVDPEGVSSVFASGVLISTNGHLITADYVVKGENSNELRVITADGKVHTATVLATDERIGVGVLKIDSSSYPALKFGSVSIKSGDSVLAIGTRGELALEPAAGVVKEIEEQFVDVQFDIDISGFGGGPVLNSKGLIIGLVYKLKPTDSNIKIDQCIRSDKIQSYLRTLKINT